MMLQAAGTFINFGSTSTIGILSQVRSATQKRHIRVTGTCDEGSATVVYPYPISLVAEAAAYDEIEVVIVVNVNRTNPYTERICVLDIKAGRLPVGTELQLNAVKITVVGTPSLPALRKIRSMIPVEIGYCPIGADYRVEWRQEWNYRLRIIAGNDSRTGHDCGTARSEYSHK